ncbi:hemolysin XhlA family protein [Metaclostridioides mangenotii]|uniref:hemolysin XhlA family protein n=1 Tax=Metaclostridioides mangenotii TaxID=1540 RepID=UPI0004B8B9C2|nr:hemolysin XhlA family protein [Clostridioides mangenotii]
MNGELIKHQIDTHKCRIDNHSERLDKLDQQQAAFAIQIETLCSDLKGLNRRT